jgi:hypothetical protein
MLPDDGVATSSQVRVGHDFDVVAGVPIAVIEERPGRLQTSGELLTAWTHEVGVRLCRSASYIFLANKSYKTVSGLRSRVIYIGTTAKGAGRPAASAVNKASQIFYKDRGVRTIDVVHRDLFRTPKPPDLETPRSSIDPHVLEYLPPDSEEKQEEARSCRWCVWATST